MANFAVAASEEVINQGNELLERLAQPGERKADTLSRLFSIVSDQIDGQAMKQGGVDVQALDASLANIRTMFLASVSGKEQIVAEKDSKIAEIKALKDQLEADLRAQLTATKTEKEQAEKVSEAAAKAAAQAVKDAETAKEQAETANNLALEKDKTIGTLADKLAAAEEKASGYDDLKAEKENLQEKCKDLERQLESGKQAADQALRDAEKEAEHKITTLTADYERKLADAARDLRDAKKDAAYELEKAISEKEREVEKKMSDQLRQADRENARLLAKIEALEAKIEEILQNQ
ncbi:MAG: hypothetical protein ACI4GD_02475 [Lachnospiraceae bacterium]